MIVAALSPSSNQGVPGPLPSPVPGTAPSSPRVRTLNRTRIVGDSSGWVGRVGERATPGSRKAWIQRHLPLPRPRRRADQGGPSRPRPCPRRPRRARGDRHPAGAHRGRRARGHRALPRSRRSARRRRHPGGALGALLRPRPRPHLPPPPRRRVRHRHPGSIAAWRRGGLEALLYASRSPTSSCADRPSYRLDRRTGPRPGTRSWRDLHEDHGRSSDDGRDAVHPGDCGCRSPPR